MDDVEFKALMEVASQWDKVEPKNEYPWHAKKHYKSVKTPLGISLEAIPQPEFVDNKTQFIPIDNIQLPDPSLIHVGEVATYVNALVPVILTQEKDADGKWIIFDGRHRLASWRAAGYKQIPVVFLKP